MSDDRRGEQRSGVEEGGGGLLSPSEEERAEEGRGDSEHDEQAVRESSDQLDTGGTR
ncbi:MAG TPA: hypothetical protein VM266_14765 [Solirubrobacteraceae bacterium]|nr:hypothetical protein [Solirubrobacteraceae bacterium]